MHGISLSPLSSLSTVVSMYRYLSFICMSIFSASRSVCIHRRSTSVRCIGQISLFASAPHLRAVVQYAVVVSTCTALGSYTVWRTRDDLLRLAQRVRDTDFHTNKTSVFFSFFFMCVKICVRVKIDWLTCLLRLAQRVRVCVTTGFQHRQKKTSVFPFFVVCVKNTCGVSKLIGSYLLRGVCLRLLGGRWVGRGKVRFTRSFGLAFLMRLLFPLFLLVFF